jgi:hypothetical protein
MKVEVANRHTAFLVVMTALKKEDADAVEEEIEEKIEEILKNSKLPTWGLGKLKQASSKKKENKNGRKSI